MSCFKRIVCQCVMLKAVKKESFTSLHRIFLFFNKYETWDYIFSNLYETYIYMKICVPTLHPLHQSHNFIQKFPIPSERWIGWRVREHVSMYNTYTCARINIKVCFESLFPSFPKSFLPTSLRISVLQKSLKKVGMKVWWICFKALILHPLSREKGDTVDMLRRKKVMNDRLIKTFWNFFFKKFWWFKNLPYLCIRFPKESLKRRVLWKI